jgi:SAM-dependent methyltransferase
MIETATGETEYRTKMIWSSLTKVSRTRFESVLDLGCGDGSILRSIAVKVNSQKAEGLDLAVSKSKSGSLVLNRGDFLDYKPRERFQLVVSNQVFEHIYEPWLPRYFSVLKESCSPGGIIMISTPNRWRPKNILRLLTFRRPYMMQPNPGVPPEKHLGHHRECSYRQLRNILLEHFREPEWEVRIIRLIPRRTESHLRWMINLLVYFLSWILWRPIFVSASQDHYVIINRKHE